MILQLIYVRSVNIIMSMNSNESCLVTNVACVHINARSVAANFSSVTEMCEIVNYAFDFIIITEAWIDKYSADFFSLPRY